MVVFGQRKGSSLVELLVLVFIVAAISLGIPYFNSGSVGSGIQSKQIITQAYTIDNSLAIWYRFHSKTYPTQLNDLKSAQVLPSDFSFSGFSYTVSSDKLRYKLTVDLPDGTSYMTSGSNL